MSITINTVVSKIEERFEKVILDLNAYGLAKSENEAAQYVETISTGWWMIFTGWPIAMGGFKEKPDFVPGQTVTIRID
jgi:hypothetical protein